MANNLTKGTVWKQIFRFALPMLIGNVFQQLYNLTDSVIVGNYLGKNALAAVGASFPIIFLLISLIIGVAMGATIMVSQFYGSKQRKNILLTNSTLMIFLLVSAIVISIIGIYFTKQIFLLINLPADLLSQAVSYLQVYLLGLVFFFGYNGVSAILRGLGDSKTPLYFLIISTVLNIILDLYFVIVLKWGVEGTAIATIVSQATAFLFAIIYLRKRGEILEFSFGRFKFDVKIFKQMLKIGIPSGLQATLVSLGMMAILSVVNSFGTDVVAAYSAAFRIDALATLPAMNFAAALSTFVGQNLGASMMERVKKGYQATLIMSSAFSVMVTIIIYFFGTNLMGIFTSDANVIRIGVEYLVIVSSFYIVFSAMFSTNAVMRGAGDTLVTLLISLIALWIVRVPTAYFLSQYMGEKGIWWSWPAGIVVGLVFSFSYYKTGRWKKKVIVARK